MKLLKELLALAASEGRRLVADLPVLQQLPWYERIGFFLDDADAGAASAVINAVAERQNRGKHGT